VSPADEIKRLLHECSLEERRAIFAHLRQEFGIHSLEDQLGAKAEVILSALARASDLTMRGVRGIIAEAAFITEVIAPGSTSRWQDLTPPGNHSFDFLLRDPAGELRVQIKLQRQKEHRPLTANEVLRSYAFPSDMYVVETQRTRRGTRSSGDNTRPYRFGEFDVLGVCLHPATGNWSDFVYTVANWLLPDPRSPDQMMKYQPVSSRESDRWTRDFERCVSWFRSGRRRRICPGYGEPSGC
jgi:hypothetical protein